jgi:malonate transporter and related proteins
MSHVIEDVLPVFLLILIGWLLVKSTYMKAEMGEALGDLVFRVAVPVLLFKTIATSDFHGASPIRLWIAYFCGVAVTWTLGHLLATRLFGRDRRIGVLAGISSAFANNVFIGLPLVSQLVGTDGIVALSILLAVHLPIMMIAGTILMEQAEAKETGKQPENLKKVIVQIGRNLVSNPLVVGLVAGSVFHILTIPVSGVLKTVVDQIAVMAAPAALLSLGMAVEKYGTSESLRLSASVGLLKLIVLPASVWAACTLLGLNANWTAAMVLTASVPTGVNAWLIANRFGVGHGLAAATITMTTAFGVFTVSFWAWLLS